VIPMKTSMIATTSLKAGFEQEQVARKVASLLGCAYILRGQKPLHQFFDFCDILFVAGNRLEVYDKHGQRTFFHPGMALTRMRRLQSGDTDVLMRLSGVARGDVVLDCTLGFASDAIVFSYCVGEEGRVIGLEADPVVWVLTKLGLHSFPVPFAEAKEAMERIEVVHADHRFYLSGMPPRSVDIVYFDPMFRQTVAQSVSLEGLRRFGRKTAVDPEAVEMACEVARKRVLLKERTGSPEFARLGFQEYQRPSRRFSYGVIEVAGR
jgi:16S rRNA (guanine1516-N2)-methyltransferase